MLDGKIVLKPSHDLCLKENIGSRMGHSKGNPFKNNKINTTTFL
jgi:hypothetical protein